MDVAAARKREQLIAGLRELADDLESRPEIPLPFVYRLGASVETAEQLAAAARAIPGTLEKDADSSYFNVRRQYPSDGSAFAFEVYAERDAVCERRPTGEYRDVAVTEVVETGETRREPIYETVCPPSLLAFDKAES